jgi:hypothetical protein
MMMMMMIIMMMIIIIIHYNIISHNTSRIDIILVKI